jgi:hypothetical protein
MFEVGNRFNDSANGAQYDTFAFNKIINCGQMGYIHGTAGDVFAANNHHLYFWNNTMISNNKDRMNGNGFGDDIYGDGQSFNNFWFFRSKYLCPNDFERNGSVTNGSAIVTISTTNIQVGSRLYDADETGGYKEVISIGTGQVTVNAPFAVTNSAYSFRVYPPISDPNWSQPTNPALCNIGGFRSILQFPSDSSQWGLWADTMIETRNNVFYATNGGAMIYPNLHGYSKQRYFHNNNIYYVKGGFVGNATTLGGTLGTGEFQTITNLFTDTTASLPENWNLLPSSGSLSVSAGTPISGFTKDFAGNTLTNPPSIGLYNYVAPATTIPTIITLPPISIVSTSATIGFNLTNEGGTPAYERGIIYSTSPIADTTSGTKIRFPFLSGTGSYSFTLTGLSPLTTYHVRAFALNAVGVAYGLDLTFTTLAAASLPIVVANSPTSVTSNSAILGGDVKSDGNASVYRRGFVYSTLPITDTTSITGGGKIINGSGLGTYSSTISSLALNTTYYVKAFALNSVGVSYSSEVYFSTSGTPPSVNSFRTRKRFIQKL